MRAQRVKLTHQDASAILPHDGYGPIDVRVPASIGEIHGIRNNGEDATNCIRATNIEYETPSFHTREQIRVLSRYVYHPGAMTGRFGV
jgi:hypothetical protein